MTQQGGISYVTQDALDRQRLLRRYSCCQTAHVLYEHGALDAGRLHGAPRIFNRIVFAYAAVREGIDDPHWRNVVTDLSSVKGCVFLNSPVDGTDRPEVIVTGISCGGEVDLRTKMHVANCRRSHRRMALNSF